MKQVKIVVNVYDNEIVSAIEKEGFGEDASSSLEYIGILENLINIEQEHLKKKLTISNG